MSMQEESWLPYAKSLGYTSEEEMLRDLYLVRQLSTSQIARALGFSRGSVNRKLRGKGIQLRRRGGNNSAGKGPLQHLPDEWFENLTAERVKESGFHPSSIFKERRRRAKRKAAKEKEQTNEIRSDSPKELLSPGG